MKQTPFFIVEPNVAKVPFVLSIPHRGTAFPDELKDRYVPALVDALDDTDWHLERLYDFAPDLGITTVYARYSRWVIDLNREPDSTPLYTDGRLITGLCPRTTFLGENIYRQRDFEPTAAETEKRLGEFYYPYHREIDRLIAELKKEFGEVLFWDAHSIRRRVETIRAEPFPDLILGDDEGRTAARRFIQTALDALRTGTWRVAHNDPFRGGYLTRSKGAPEAGVHALQLEMAKDLYMSNDETEYDPERAARVKALLKRAFENLIAEL